MLSDDAVEDGAFLARNSLFTLVLNDWETRSQLRICLNLLNVIYPVNVITIPSPVARQAKKKAFVKSVFRHFMKN